MTRKMWTIALVVVVLVVLAFGARAMAQGEGEVGGRRTITVTSTATVGSEPDQATLSVGVESQADDSAAALADNGSVTDDVLSALRGAGVRESDVQTERLDVFRRVVDRKTPRERTVFVAETVSSVTVRDLDSVGSVIEAAVGAGATSVRDVRFEVSDPAAARAQALGAGGRGAGSRPTRWPRPRKPASPASSASWRKGQRARRSRSPTTAARWTRQGRRSRSFRLTSSTRASRSRSPGRSAETTRARSARVAVRDRHAPVASERLGRDLHARRGLSPLVLVAVDHAHDALARARARCPGRPCRRRRGRPRRRPRSPGRARRRAAASRCPAGPAGARRSAASRSCARGSAASSPAPRPPAFRQRASS